MYKNVQYSVLNPPSPLPVAGRPSVKGGSPSDGPRLDESLDSWRGIVTSKTPNTLSLPFIFFFTTQYEIYFQEPPEGWLLLYSITYPLAENLLT